MRLITPPGVFKPHSDSWALSELLRDHVGPGDSVLDLCTGSGLLAVSAALAGAGDVTAIDVSRRSVLTARINARLNGVRVRALRGDLFAPIGARRFDLIVSNPPYVPAEREELPTRGLARAWDAGSNGRALLDRICAQASRHLRPRGALLIVHSTVCGEPETLHALRAAGLQAEVIVRQPGPLGRLLSERAPLLVQRGLLDRGADYEELLYVLARAPAAPAPEPATVVPYRDGPYLVSGAFTLRDQDGNPIASERKTVALCRCGRSKQRPFCDGTHKTIGFRSASGREGDAVPAAANANGNGRAAAHPPAPAE